MTNESISLSIWLNNLGHGSPIVLGVLYFLVALSFCSWFLIAYKALGLWRMGTSPFIHLTETGTAALKQYQRYREGLPEIGGNISEHLTRALRQAIDDQITRFEGGLGVLATIGNTAPFVGLFGTVIGIMAALKGISLTGSAGLDVVAGPIGEALIATGAGIACAVPAVVAYNTFVRRVRVLNNTLDGFAYDLLARLMAEESSRGLSKEEVEVKV